MEVEEEEEEEVPGLVATDKHPCLPWSGIGRLDGFEWLDPWARCGKDRLWLC